MKITVIFTGADGPIPDGTAIVFENAGDIRLSMPNDVEVVDCAAEGCHEPGLRVPHRRLTGTHHLELKATGTDGDRPLWEIAGQPS